MNKSDFAFKIILFTCLGHALTHIYLELFPPILESMARDFSMSYREICVYFSLCNLCFGLGAIPSGWLSDRIGEKALLVAFFLGCAIGGILLGVAANPWMLLTGVVVLGLATSIYHPVGNALISKGMPNRGRAMGVNGIAGSIGTALGPICAGVSVALTSSWRWAFLAFALPALLLGLWMRGAALGPAAQPSQKHLQGNKAGEPRRRLPLSIIVFFILVLTTMTLTGFYYKLIITILPLHLSQNSLLKDYWFKDKVADGGIKMGISLIFGAAGQFLAGLLCDRFKARWIYVINLAIVVPMALAVGYASGSFLLALACLASVFLFGTQPVENTVIAQFSPPHWRGAIYGAKFILAFGVGGGLGSLAAGWIKESFKEDGLVRIFDVAAAAALIAFFCATAASLIPIPSRSASQDPADPREAPQRQ